MGFLFLISIPDFALFAPPDTLRCSGIFESQTLTQFFLVFAFLTHWGRLNALLLSYDTGPNLLGDLALVGDAILMLGVAMAVQGGGEGDMITRFVARTCVTLLKTIQYRYHLGISEHRDPAQYYRRRTPQV